MANNSIRILSPEELRTLKGIRFSRAHLHRKIKEGSFPRPLKLGDNTNGFVESEVDAWIAQRIAERDAKAA